MTLQDCLDHCHILTDVMAQKLIEARSTHVPVFNVPHLVDATVLYDTARSLGIETVILPMSHFPNLSFSMRPIENFGAFDPKAGHAKPLPIGRDKETELF